MILGEGDTFIIDASFGISEKKININFSKPKRKICSSLHYNSDNSYLFVSENKICKVKATNRNNNFPSQFCLGSISNKFDYSDVK